MSTSTSPSTRIHIETRYVAPAGPSMPALALQATCLVNSYMLWIGATDEPEENVGRAPLQGSLTRDWACAMPPQNTASVASALGTPLFRSSTSDIALSMSQRLARRFKKQVFLSVDVPAMLTSSGGQGGQVVLAVEKALVETLKELESAQQG